MVSIGSKRSLLLATCAAACGANSSRFEFCQAPRWLQILIVVAAAIGFIPSGNAAITIVGSGSAATASSGATSVTVTTPAGTTLGDLLIVQIAVRGGSNTNITATGWTQLLIDTRSTVIRQALYYRFLTTVPAANYSFSFTTTNNSGVVSAVSVRGAGGIISLRGVDPEAPFNVTSTRNNAASTSVTATGVTPTLSDSLLLGYFATANGNSFTPPAGMTERYDRFTQAGPNGIMIELAQQSLTSNAATGNKVATAGASADNIGMLVVLKPDAIDRLEYRFDECSYSGAAAEVRDSIGSNHGTARNSTTITTAGFIGSAANLDHYSRWIETNFALSRDWTFSFWLKKPFVTGNSRYYIPAAMSTGSDLMFLDANNNFIWGVYTTSGTTYGTYSFNTLASGWHHVVLVGRGGSTQLFVNSASVDTVARKVSAGTLRYIGSSFDDINTVNAQGFRVPIDELRVYEGSLSQNEIDTLYKFQVNGLNADGSTRTTALCGVAELVVTASETASTCVDHQITITAYNAGGAVEASYTGTVELQTSSGRGQWLAGPSSGPITENGNLNDGIASYSFVSGDNGSATLLLRNQSADDLTVTVKDSAASLSGSSKTLSFRDLSFVITSIDTLANTPVAGRSHAMRATLWRRDNSLTTPLCGVATNYTGVKALRAWYQGDADHPPAANAPSLGTILLPSATPTANNVQLTFVAGVADFSMGTSDIGKYMLEFLDSSRSFANAVDIGGMSSLLTVRPFALGIINLNAAGNSNPEGTATSGSAFTASGALFAADIAAYLWNTADDTNNDGVVDAGANLTNNSLTPSFAWPVNLSVDSSATYFTPLAGAVGLLSGTTAVPQTSFANGLASVADLQYAEFGSIGINATSTNFLNTAGVNISGGVLSATTGQPTRLGRFRANNIVLVSSSVTSACGSLNYMDQDALALSFNLEARNANNLRINNYDAGLLGANIATVEVDAEDNDEGVNLGARLSGIVGQWTAGQYQVNVADAVFNRAVAVDGPFDNLQLGIRLTDALDNRQVDNLDMRADNSGACAGTCTARAIGAPQRFRYGRLVVQPGFGPETDDLPSALLVESYVNSAFRLETADSCTSYGTPLVSLSNYTGALTNGETTAITPATATLINGSFDLDAPIVLSAPGLGNDGTVELRLNVPVWLEFDWNGTGNEDPGATMSFGRYRGHDRIIFKRDVR